MNTDTMGVYGNYYLKRASVAQLGLGANLPEDAIYPVNLGDETGTPLDGANKYTIHFEKGAAPPANAFWSITLYDPDGFQVANSLNRFAVSSWMPFKYNPDGSLDLYFQNENPGNGKEANWLPAPKGAFNLTMRLYAPKIGSAHRQMESSADREDAGNGGSVGSVRSKEAMPVARIERSAIRDDIPVEKPRITRSLSTGRHFVTTRWLHPGYGKNQN